MVLLGSSRKCHASLNLGGVRGGLTIETGDGGIYVEGEPRGNWHIGPGSGTFDPRFPLQVSFNHDARTSSGRLKVTRPITVHGLVSRNHLQGKAGNGRVPLEVHAASGNIEID